MMKPWRMRLGAVVVAAALSLTGCASGSGGSSPSASGASQPVKIGALFAPTDSLDPATASSPGSMMLSFNIYDSLAVMTKDGTSLSLAKSVEPNATADEWTITLRDGLTYSDGTAATGQDIIDSLSHLAQSPSYTSLYSGIDFEASSASGSTATLKLKAPASDFLESSLGMFSTIAPKGEFNGVGAGPFVFDKGDPSTGYELRANDKYWEGAPSIPQLTFVPIPDSAAQANALRTGEIDLATGLNAAALTSLSGAQNITVADPTLESAGVLELALNTRVAPFNDPELRRAAKLTVDREKMVNTVLGSTGEIGNDMLGKGYAAYPEDNPQTTANKEEAKRIFAEKGVTSFTIVASDVLPGVVASAELMVQEFAEIGVQVTVDKRDPKTFYNNIQELHQSQAVTAYWINRSPITQFRSQLTPDYPFNMSGFTSETVQQNLAKATSTLDPAEQKTLVGEISKEVHDQGGDLIWGYQKQVSAYRTGLEGANTSQSIPQLAKATFNPVG